MKEQKSVSKVGSSKIHKKLFWDSHIMDHFNSPFESMFNELFDEFINSFMPTKIGPQLKCYHGSYPKCNIMDNQNEYTIEMQIPGITKDAIKIEYDVNTQLLSIIGEKRTNSQSDDTNNYIIKQLRKSKFIRSFYIPSSQIEQEFNAQFKDGILIIKINKKPRVDTISNIKKIQIK